MNSSSAVPVSAQSSHVSGLTIAVLGAILFSAKAILAKLMYRHGVDAMLVMALRMIMSVPFFFLIGWWQARKLAPLSWADRGRIVVLGMIGYYLSSFLDFLGLQYITAALERLILYLTPSFVLLLSVVFLKRSISRRQLVSLAIAYAGIVLVLSHDLEIAGSNVWLGTVLVTASAVFYAIYLIASGEAVKRIGALRLVAYAMCVSTVPSVLQFLLLRPAGQLLTQPLPVYWLSFLNAVMCTVLPVTMTMVAVARIGAPLASQAGLIGPVSTLLLGFWLLGEPITTWQLAGGALVMVGMYLLTSVPRAARQA
ncbi:DMT family transporter [Imbroritus primus]|uniref:DMT family transporter n=1 Tax=Imbroritus primus TaxID=3058603 RepID=UPI003D1607DB